MTVCVASLFRWNYAEAGRPPKHGLAALTVSDRMITAGDVKYEPFQLKVSFMTKRTLILIAGDYSVHTQALRATTKQVLNRSGSTPEDIAMMYGRAIQAVKQRQAEDLYLAPLGMNSDTFLAQQRDMSDGFVNRITDQLQGYPGDEVEALVVGADGERVSIYKVDTRGTVDCYDDVGFAAVGIGAWHARSRLMQFGYTNGLSYYPALSAAFAAKKSAELAPGVGSATDIHLVLHNQEPVTVDTTVSGKLDELYLAYEESRERLVVAGFTDLEVWDEARKAEQRANEEARAADRSAAVDGGHDTAATETAARPQDQKTRKR